MRDRSYFLWDVPVTDPELRERLSDLDAALAPRAATGLLPAGKSPR